MPFALTNAPAVFQAMKNDVFIVDASDVEVEAVHSQRCPKDNKVPPCAFFSRKLSPAERNYDVGNRGAAGI